MKQHLIGFLIAVAVFVSAVAVERLNDGKPSLVAMSPSPSGRWYVADLGLVCMDRFFANRHYRAYPINVVGGTYSNVAPGVLRWTVRAYVAPLTESLPASSRLVLVGQEVFPTEAAAARRLESLQQNPDQRPDGFAPQEWPTHQFRSGTCVYFLCFTRAPYMPGANDLVDDLELDLERGSGSQSRA